MELTLRLRLSAAAHCSSAAQGREEEELETKQRERVRGNLRTGGGQNKPPQDSSELEKRRKVIHRGADVQTWSEFPYALLTSPSPPTRSVGP